MSVGNNGAANPGGTNGDGSKAPEANQQSGNVAPQSGQPQAGNSTAQSAGTDLSVLLSRFDDLDSKIKKVSSENQSLRKRLKGLGSEDEEGDGKTGKSEMDPALLESLNKLKTGRIKDQLTASARAAGAHNPETLWRMLDDLGSVSDDEGNLKNPDKVMADLRKAYPAYFKPLVQGPADGGTGSGANGSPDMNAIVRGGFQRMRGQ
jgi:hypothetical protein